MSKQSKDHYIPVAASEDYHQEPRATDIINNRMADELMVACYQEPTPKPEPTAEDINRIKNAIGNFLFRLQSNRLHTIARLQREVIVIRDYTSAFDRNRY